jgi:uncharacterized protein YegL
MRGEAIDAVKSGIEGLVQSLRQDPYALETVYLSIITFDNDAKQIVPLTEVYNFRMNEIQASGKSALGAALLMLANKLDEEVVKTTYEVKGDWKPLIFIMIDGGHSGGYKKSLAELKKRKAGIIISCAMGKSVHMNVLKEISENVVCMDKNDVTTIKEFFKWISDSVGVSSKKVDGNTEIASISELPKLPIGITFYDK